jgi:hypothetical protein
LALLNFLELLAPGTEDHALEIICGMVVVSVASVGPQSEALEIPVLGFVVEELCMLMGGLGILCVSAFLCCGGHRETNDQ